MINATAETLVKVLSEKKLKIVFAESCTAGLVSDLIASIPGASNVFWGSFVTYTIDAKIKVLGLDPATLERYGTVSRETARYMAQCALKVSGADIAVSVTGLAGPSGNGSSAPVGTVFIGVSLKNKTAQGGLRTCVKHHFFEGARPEIRKAAAEAALIFALKKLLQ